MTNSSIIVNVCFFLILNLLPLFAQDSIPPIPDRIENDMKRLQKTDPVLLLDYTANGGLIVSRRYKETMQLFCIDKPASELRQLTFDTNPIFYAKVNPDPDHHCLIFEKDSSGNEINQIYTFDLISHKSRLITDGISQNGNSVWSNKGDRFAFASTMKNGKDWGIYICSIDTPKTAAPLLEKSGAWGIEDWAPDDSKLLISQYISSNESKYYIIDIKTKELTPLCGSDTSKMALDLGMWSRDGKGLFYTSDKNTEHRVLYYLNFEKGEQKPLTKDIHWNIRDFALSKDGSVCMVSTNEHGYGKIYQIHLRDYSIKQMKDIPEGVIGNLRLLPGDSVLAFNLNQPLETDAIYSVNIHSGNVKKWTNLINPDISMMKKPVVISYPTFDSINRTRRMIPCFYYKPQGRGPFPVVIIIHGGPESQFWPYYSPQITFLLSVLQCAVLAPNVRGSNGYGKTWLSLDDGYRREDAVKDIGALLDWVDSQQSLDKKRIAVMGGSYGGYMSLASMIHYSEHFKAGIDLYGISNFITYMQKTRGSRVDLRRVEYGDERDPSMYRFLQRISPLSSAEKIKRPMLIVQGANDARVPAYESEQIVNALKRNKISVWYLLFSDEGHGFNKKNNKDYEEKTVVYFLEKYLIH